MDEVNLGTLPPSGDEFWQYSKKFNHDMNKIEQKCNHFFKRMNGREVECVKCHIGFVLGVGWLLKDGHIYKGKEKVL